MPNSNEKFQPQQHLVQRDGAKYLPLKWRLAWLRSDHPDAQVSTRLVSHQDGFAVFRATIKLPNGGSAASWGARSRISGDGDQDLTYISEAENQALERALTMLGYGTEYSVDFDVPTEQEGFALEVVSLPEPSRFTPVATAPTTTPTPISRNVKPNVPAQEEEPEDEVVISTADLEDSDEDDEETDEDEVDETPRPTNLRPVGGRQTPARPAAPVTPLPTTPRNQPTTPTPVSRPAPRTTVTPAPVPSSAGSGVANQAVLDRVRGIDDPALVLLIKQIYHEARRLYGLNEESVDMRSQRTYKLPANELNQEQAEEFLEKIKSGARRTQQ